MSGERKKGKTVMKKGRFGNRMRGGENEGDGRKTCDSEREGCDVKETGGQRFSEGKACMKGGSTAKKGRVFRTWSVS